MASVGGLKIHGEVSPSLHTPSIRRESFSLKTHHDLNKLIPQSNESQEATKNFAFYENIRLRIKYLVYSTWYGMVYKRILLAVSITSVFLYIMETYYDEKSNPDAFFFLNIIELSTAILFGFDWSLSVYLADQKIETILGFNAMVDSVTVLVVMSSNFIFTENVAYPDITTTKDVFIYILYCLQTVRILRITRLIKELEVIDDLVNRFLSQITLAFITMLLFGKSDLECIYL
jgi:hypothetical protein